MFSCFNNVYVIQQYFETRNMEYSTQDHHQTEIKPSQDSLPARPVPRPFSIEALMSDCGPRNTHSTPLLPWNLSPTHNERYQNVRDFGSRDTDSDNSLDIELAQDLSRTSQKDGRFFIIFLKYSENFTFI